MQLKDYHVAQERYAKCIEVSKRVRWDIDEDVIRGREFDFSQLYKDIFLFHWKEETTHAMMDELEWPREDSKISDEERDQAVGELIALVADVDGILQNQSAADVDYLVNVCDRSFSGDEIQKIKDGVLTAYRWQYIFSGVEHPRFQKLLVKLTSENQRERLNEALKPLQF